MTEIQAKINIALKEAQEASVSESSKWKTIVWCAAILAHAILYLADRLAEKQKP